MARGYAPRVKCESGLLYQHFQVLSKVRGEIWLPLVSRPSDEGEHEPVAPLSTATLDTWMGTVFRFEQAGESLFREAGSVVATWFEPTSGMHQMHPLWARVRVTT